MSIGPPEVSSAIALTRLLPPRKSDAAHHWDSSVTKGLSGEIVNRP
jgi:hypothetical protein